MVLKAEVNEEVQETSWLDLVEKQVIFDQNCLLFCYILKRAESQEKRAYILSEAKNDCGWCKPALWLSSSLDNI